MAGRKSKYTPERVKQITDALSIGATHEDAFTNAGISHQTFYRWLETKSDFREAVNRAQTNAHLAAVGAIRYAIQGHPEESTTTETYTETRLRWGENDEQVPYQHTRTVRKHTVSHVAPDWRAAIDYLKRRDPEHWSDKINITLEGDLTAEFVNRIVRQLTDMGVQSPAQAFEEYVNALHREYQTSSTERSESDTPAD